MFALITPKKATYPLARGDDQTQKYEVVPPLAHAGNCRNQAIALKTPSGAFELDGDITSLPCETSQFSPSTSTERDCVASFEPLPHKTLLPQSTLKASRLLLPHNALVPHRALLPHNTF